MTHRWSERLVMLCGMLSLICLASGPDEAAQLLDRRLAALDAKAAKIVDLTADFRQEKFTALLKKPLVSSGRGQSKGSVVRWDTVQPGPVVLYADAKSLRLYYPKQQSEEVYPVDRRLGDLLASPLPRLAALRDHFSLAAASEAQAAALSPFAKPEEKSAALFVTLTPTDDLLKQNVQNVVVGSMSRQACPCGRNDGRRRRSNSDRFFEPAARYRLDRCGFGLEDCTRNKDRLSAARDRGSSDATAMNAVPRRRATEFWLTQLFRFAGCAPRLLLWVRRPVCLLAYMVVPTMRRATLANARRVLGESSTNGQCRQLALDVINHFYLFCCDMGRAIRLSPEQLRARIEAIEGHERFLKARSSRRGVILVTAHMGSFETAMAALSAIEPRIHVVFRRDNIGEFERQRQALRSRLGIIEAALDEGFAIWPRLREAPLNNEAVLLQGDRVLPGQKGQVVPFLGGHVELPTGPVKLALASGPDRARFCDPHEPLAAFAFG